jgi:hypothetical protein
MLCNHHKSPERSTHEQEQKGGEDKVLQKDETQSQPMLGYNEDTTMNWDIP